MHTTSELSLDLMTLSVVAVCVAGLLGLFLLEAWRQERIRALAWWGAAYLLGGLSVAIWSVEHLFALPLPVGLANALLFVACGMMWSAARVFHGRPVQWGAMTLGAVLWLAAGLSPEFGEAAMWRIVLSSLVVSTYTFLTAAELWRERRKSLMRRWPAIFVPALHCAVFLFPIPLASFMPNQDGMVVLATGWVALFGLEMMLYAVGTAFIVFVLTKERVVRAHRDAAFTDPLTGVLNRRGFMEAAGELIARRTYDQQPVTVLMFDLDHFKSINDRFGHATGDEALRVFAATISGSMREHDVIGRLGGEEFAAILPATLLEGLSAAERVRGAFARAGVEIAGHAMGATVSIGVASGVPPGIDLKRLLTEADGALYRAKKNGRNAVQAAEPESKSESEPELELELTGAMTQSSRRHAA